MSTPPPVTVALTTADRDRVVIALGGEIDHVTAARMHDDVLALIDNTGTDSTPGVHVLLDFSQVRFCDSSGMSALLGIWRRLHTRGGTLTVTALPANIAKALRIGGLDQLIPIVAADTPA
ncbi:anti-anti-sigma regulatory factor, SpoIIAA [Lentzea xinjiangensis]|uniref:Anti-sigma factor antagonist n=1 Tax=Lentzea xinjiangensis TaxID=402600 RepID=A0A1H9TSY7_9PSEU|nr:STAS domain-containing protein [Lentzea xinjiangensis]SES00121.1 anti-anti-sigma regulatory factor, SpoIIAA [Lentzea xinjiangensis]